MKYFSLGEFNCQETGENEMNSEFLMRLDLLREACGLYIFAAFASFTIEAGVFFLLAYIFIIWRWLD